MDGQPRGVDEGVGTLVCRDAWFEQRADEPRRVLVVAVTAPSGAALSASRAPSRASTFTPLSTVHRHLAVCDIAVVQGGLTTCMELTANRRPFIYVPLRNHFEQHFHVRHRLHNYGAGRCLPYDELGPDTLAAAIAEEIDRPVGYRPVATDGAARAARLIADLV